MDEGMTMSRLSQNLSDGTITRTDLFVAGFWVLLGILGFIIAASIGVPALGYLGPVLALGWGVYYLIALAKREPGARR
jgi:hypothetical protein